MRESCLLIRGRGDGDTIRATGAIIRTSSDLAWASRADRELPLRHWIDQDVDTRDICAKTRFAFEHGHEESGGTNPGPRPVGLNWCAAPLGSAPSCLHPRARGYRSGRRTRRVRRRDIHHDRRRSTLPAAPLVDGADAVRIVEDVVRDGRARHLGPERQVVLNNAGAGRGKKPSESKQPWDNYKLLATGPGDRAFRSAKDSGCPLTK